MSEIPAGFQTDPVYRDDGSQGKFPGWYFYEETWADTQGPFESETEARLALGRYCRFLDGIGEADYD